ncbi:hypothetical protein KIN20_021743 [Parelaphostrongylus tenuis]|uniref:Uncharacterized protein n=1 Tax=Parelaphostrongylus tenuis TaxID=148309 RepID=A0AAD5QUD1_PARTN|nr:hypothetical protein KIN20_021743 [Parelaphostrongylus tenuis]
MSIIEDENSQSENIHRVHSPVLLPDDAYVRDESVENLQRLREENSFTDFNGTIISNTYKII